MVSVLRETAEAIRKIAAEIGEVKAAQEPAEKVASVQLDTNHVLSFLKFFGGSVHE